MISKFLEKFYNNQNDFKLIFVPNNIFYLLLLLTLINYLLIQNKNIFIKIQKQLNIIKQSIMNQHVNVEPLLNLNPDDIRKFNNDQIYERIGWTHGMSENQLQICKWPISLLNERLLLLAEHQAYCLARDLVNKQQLELKKMESKIDKKQIKIKKLQTAIQNNLNQKKCWKCGFLEKGIGFSLAFILIFTIVLGLLITFESSAETEAQKSSKVSIIWVYAGIGIGLTVCLLLWGILRIYYLQHSLH